MSLEFVNLPFLWKTRLRLCKQIRIPLHVYLTPRWSMPRRAWNAVTRAPDASEVQLLGRFSFWPNPTILIRSVNGTGCISSLANCTLQMQKWFSLQESNIISKVAISCRRHTMCDGGVGHVSRSRNREALQKRSSRANNNRVNLVKRRTSIVACPLLSWAWRTFPLRVRISHYSRN